MNKTNSTIRAWAGSDRPSVPSLSEVRTSAHRVATETRQAAEVAKQKAREAQGLAMAVVIGTAFWLSDVREDGTPSPISRVEAFVDSPVDRLKAFGGAVMERIAGSVESVAEVLDPTVGHQQLAEHRAVTQTDQQFESLGGE